MNAPLSQFLRGAAHAAFFAVILPAQYYWPPAYAATPGNAVMNAPFTSQPGHPTMMTRCMVIIDPSSLPFPPNTVLTQLSLRRDHSYPNQAYGGGSGNLTVNIGRAVAPPDQVQDVRFERLWDGGPTRVYVNSAFNLPAGPAPGASLSSFNVVIPFTPSFTWTGGPLAIEFQWTPTGGSSAWRVDAFAVPRPQNGTDRPAGLGCAGSNGFTPQHYALPETTMPGSLLTLQMQGSKLPPNPGAIENHAIHMIGLQNTTYQSQPLPVALSTVGGPPGCFLRVDPLLTFTVFTSNPSLLFARATSQVSLPAHPALIGAVLYSQWLLFDTGYAVPLPLTASDAIAITLGQVAPPPTVRAARTIWKYGSTGFGLASGRMVPDDYGPILRFN